MPSLFDLHCDTAYEMYKSKQGIMSNTLGVDIDKLSVFDNKFLCFAIWSDENLSDDEAYVNFKHVSAEFLENVSQNADKIMLCTWSVKNLLHIIIKSAMITAIGIACYYLYVTFIA